MSFLKDFKEFAIKGNVIDLAVAVIIGAAFGKIVSSLVNDIVMPVIGLLIGGIDFTGLKIVLKEGTGDVKEVAIMYGQFLQNVLDFLIIAFAVFVVVRAYRNMERKEEQAPAGPSPAAPTNEEQLLAEIRDLLKEKPIR